MDIRKMIALKKGDDYYKLCHDTDPTYGPYEALREWFASNVDDAKRIIQELGLEMDYDYWEDPYDLVENTFTDVVDAFNNGRFSQFSDSDDYFYIDTYGHVSSITENEYKSRVYDCIKEHAEEIMHSDKLPAELKKIVAYWDED